MKYLIASDIHGSSRCCGLLKERIEAEMPDKVILLGDLLYHGARNALPLDYSTLETASILNSLKDRLACVRGNCDSEVDQMVLEFPIGAEYGLIVLPNGRNVFFAHGHREIAHLQKGDVLICGHFHIPAFEERENYTYINCGSVSIPKGGSKHSYLVLDGTRLYFRDLMTGACFMQQDL